MERFQQWYRHRLLYQLLIKRVERLCVAGNLLLRCGQEVCRYAASCCSVSGSDAVAVAADGLTT